jgi:hypothetical protein
MAGYFEMFVMIRDRENCKALHPVTKFILDHADNPKIVSMEWDNFLRSDVGLTMAVPDEHQFDRLLDAFRELSTTADSPLLSLVCYRSGRPNELALADDELSIEYFNPRPDHDGYMIRHTDSAVRLTHRLTGMVAISKEARSRHSNLHTARQMLSAKLAENASALLLSKRSIEGLQRYPFPTPTR